MEIYNKCSFILSRTKINLKLKVNSALNQVK